MWLTNELRKNREASQENRSVILKQMDVMTGDLRSWAEIKFEKAFERIEDLEKKELINRTEISKERHRNNNQDMIIKNKIGRDGK